MTENQKKLLKILTEIFQLNQSDLDFGIYRIMNSKSKEITEFLENDLLSQVTKAFEGNDNSAIQTELDALVKTLNEAGVNPDDSPKVQEFQKKLSQNASSATLENEVFSHLATFFRRYYSDGDFISLRRYKKDTYAIPYEGEEVKLHWANADQYYIKSGENFRDYRFIIKGEMMGEEEKVIHLRLVDAETEQNNNKATAEKERRFVIVEENEEEGRKICEVIENELYINFEYKPVGKENQDKLNEGAVERIYQSGIDASFIDALKTPAPTEKNKKRTLFEKHLKDYTSRNSFDYFIHKDLGGFLHRELDFYIKNEMLFIDDIEENPVKFNEVMNKLKCFRKIAGKLIHFLSQLEGLQKKLWEKKKFVIETNYCITLDKIDEKHYDEILKNKEQLEEWKMLFDVDVLKPKEDSVFKNASPKEYLKENRFLVLDTKFFDTKFKYSLLSQFENLDEEIDGVLINSENFGALRLLQERYREQIKCIYIDPPYNTGEDGFIYKDGYPDSTWLTCMESRLTCLDNFFTKDWSSLWINIDDNEGHNLKVLCDNIFGREKFIAANIWQKRYSRENREAIGDVHDYIFTYSPFPQAFKESRKKVELTEKQAKVYTNPNKDPKGRWRTIPLTAQAGHATKDQFYEIKAPGGKVHIPPSGRCWGIAKATFEKHLNEGRIYFGKDNNSQPNLVRYLTEVEGITPWTWWPHEEVGHTDESKKELYSILEKETGFDTPKPSRLMKRIVHIATDKNDIVLDYFAGSGTTGHAVINLNREDDGKRKYILVEMGEYFDTVTKPRIQKVIYTDNWKNGKPQDQNGISQIFKYFKLESYEDTLNNLEFEEVAEEKKTLFKNNNPSVQEDYILNYSLHHESDKSLLNIDGFKNPFDYKLKIATSSVGETKETTVDLVETFNYLIGIKVKRMELIKDVLVVEGASLKGEKILIIWRNDSDNNKLDAFFGKMDWTVYDRKFDTLYVNGDNNLANLQEDEENFKVKLIEEEFKNLMFGTL